MRSDRRSQRCGIGCGKRKYGLLRAAQMPAHRRQQQRERIQRALVRVHAAGRLQHLCLCLPSCILQLRRCSAVQAEADHPAKPRPERLCAAEHEQKVHIRVCAIRACVDKAGLRGKRRLLAKGIRRQIAERCEGEFCEPFPKVILAITDAWYNDDPIGAMQAQKFSMKVRKLLKTASDMNGYFYACELLDMPFHGTRMPHNMTYVTDEQKAFIKAGLQEMKLI